MTDNELTVNVRFATEYADFLLKQSCIYVDMYVAFHALLGPAVHSLSYSQLK
jgi:hypothetical protein